MQKAGSDEKRQITIRVKRAQPQRLRRFSSASSMRLSARRGERSPCRWFGRGLATAEMLEDVTRLQSFYGRAGTWT
jgi:hypothetical protein